MTRKLTAKQRAWAKYYIVDYNATQAAIKAKYAPASASTRGYELSHNPVVMGYVDRLTEKLNKKLEIDALYVRQRLVDIDRLDVRDILTDEGLFLPTREWPDQWCSSINSFELIFSKETVGTDGKIINGQVSSQKIKWPDKIKTLELLGKHISVKAWDRDHNIDAGSPPPLQITFGVAEAKGDVRTTNANP